MDIFNQNNTSSTLKMRFAKTSHSNVMFKNSVKKFEEIVTDEGHTEAISLHVRRTDQVVKPTFHPVQPNLLL